MTRRTAAGIAPVVAQVKELTPRDGLRARLLFGALVETLLNQEGLSIFIVGGTAVDTYVSEAIGTSEAYPAEWHESRDVDAIILRGLSPAEKEAAVDALAPFGFTTNATHRVLQHPDMHWIIDMVGYGIPDDYSVDHRLRVYTEDIEEQALTPPWIAGPEDILFDYMESGWDTRHQRDWARALAIAAAMEEHLDLGYLISKAHWRGEAWVPVLEQVLRGEPLVLRGGRALLSDDR